MTENECKHLKVGDILAHNHSEAIALITVTNSYPLERLTTIKFLINGPFIGPVMTSYDIHRTWQKIT